MRLAQRAPLTSFGVIAIFPGAHVPLDITERRRVLLALPAHVQSTVLSDLTKEFYETPDDVPALLEEYVAKNACEFPTFGSADEING